MDCPNADYRLRTNSVFFLNKNVVFSEAKGLAHEWQTWRYALHDFAPRLFQQTDDKSKSGS